MDPALVEDIAENPIEDQLVEFVVISAAITAKLPDIANKYIEPMIRPIVNASVESSPEPKRSSVKSKEGPRKVEPPTPVVAASVP